MSIFHDAYFFDPLVFASGLAEYTKLLPRNGAKHYQFMRAAALESLIAIRRAGASILITYWAKDAAEWLA